MKIKIKSYDFLSSNEIIFNPNYICVVVQKLVQINLLLSHSRTSTCHTWCSTDTRTYMYIAGKCHIHRVICSRPLLSYSSKSMHTEDMHDHNMKAENCIKKNKKAEKVYSHSLHCPSSLHLWLTMKHCQKDKIPFLHLPTTFLFHPSYILLY